MSTKGGWYLVYVLMCTLILTAYLLSLSSHAIRNGPYEDKYTFENFMNETLDHGSTHSTGSTRGSTH